MRNSKILSSKKNVFFSPAWTMSIRHGGSSWESRQQITGENRKTESWVVHCADSMLQIRSVCLVWLSMSTTSNYSCFAFLLVCQMKFLSKKPIYIIYIHTHLFPIFFLSKKAESLVPIQGSFRDRTALGAQALGF